MTVKGDGPRGHRWYDTFHGIQFRLYKSRHKTLHLLVQVRVLMNFRFGYGEGANGISKRRYIRQDWLGLRDERLNGGGRLCESLSWAINDLAFVKIQSLRVGYKFVIERFSQYIQGENCDLIWFDVARLIASHSSLD